MQWGARKGAYPKRYGGTSKTNLSKENRESTNLGNRSSLYYEQWIRLLDTSQKLREFLEENKAAGKLKLKQT